MASRTPLEEQVVYHNLKWEWTWRGMGLFHLIACVLPTVLYLGVGSLIPALSKAYALPLFFASTGVTFTLHYRQPRGWIERWVDTLGLPRFLSHRMRANEPPFPVSREELTWRQR